MPGRSTKEKGREEGELDEDSEERKNWNEIAQEVVAGIKEKASAHDDAKATAKRTAGRSVKQNWDCSQIEKEDQMEVQWAEDEKLEESLEGRRTEGSSLQAEVMQKVPELVVRERMSQVEENKVRKRKEGGESERMVY